MRGHALLMDHQLVLILLIDLHDKCPFFFLGDHVPTGANGQNSAPFVATQAPRRVAAAPQPQQFTQAAVQPASSDYDYYEDINPTQNTFVPTQTQNFVPQPQQNFAPATNSNPFINPHDPTHRDF